MLVKHHAEILDTPLKFQANLPGIGDNVVNDGTGRLIQEALGIGEENGKPSAVSFEGGAALLGEACKGGPGPKGDSVDRQRR